MIGEEGRFLHRDGLRYRDGEKFPDDHQDWEPGDYERFYAGPDDEYLEGLPFDVEEELQYYEVDPEQYVDGQVSGSCTVGTMTTRATTPTSCSTGMQPYATM